MSKKIVCVEWDDASNNTGYWDDDAIKAGKKKFEPVKCLTVGHLMRSNKKVVNVASEHFTEDDDFRNIHTIPRGMIRKITILEPKK